MREGLYASKAAPSVTPDTLIPASAPVARGWDQAPAPTLIDRTKPRMPLAVKFFIGALLFFLVAGSLTAAYLIWGSGSISDEHVDILVDGPTTSASGETVTLLITVQNRNPVAIDVSNLGIDYPPGTRDADDPDKELTHQNFDVGTIEAGGGFTQTVRATLFGSENQKLSIPMRVEYETENSNATFQKSEPFDITITTSPLSVNATSIKETSSGQSVTFSLAVRANSTEPIENVALSAQYPYGFTVTNTSIQSRNSGTFFSLGTLEAGEEKRFTVTGTLAGVNDDTRVFNWSAGTSKDAESGKLDLAYASAVSEIGITRPFIEVALTVDGDTSAKPVIEAGKRVGAQVNWKNTLPTSILDAKISVKLSGAALDPYEVSSGDGFFQSGDMTILFDRDTSRGLRELAPGDTGVGQFSFASLDGDALANLSKQEITLVVSVAGRRLSESGVSESLSSILTRTVKVATGFTFDSRAVRTQGPFENQGPWPPTVGVPTTYTIQLTAENTVNEVAGASATMTIPSYVTYTGLATPADGSVVYNEASRTITWNIGSLPAHGKKDAAFQVSLTPSISQQGDSPTLISAQKVTGTDRFTQAPVGLTAPAIDIRTHRDPAYQSSFGQVQ